MRRTCCGLLVTGLFLSTPAAPAAALPFVEVWGELRYWRPILESEIVASVPGAPGDTVDTALSVWNNKGWTFRPRLEEVRVRLTLGIPAEDSFTASVTVYLWPEQTLRVPFDFTVVEFFPKGLYSLTLEAFELSDPTMPPSSAMATLRIY